MKFLHLSSIYINKQEIKKQEIKRVEYLMFLCEVDWLIKAYSFQLNMKNTLLNIFYVIGGYKK